MNYLLFLALVMLTPMSEVVSGGRSTSFSMKSGLLPVAGWMHVPGIPLYGSGIFTEMAYQGGWKKSFRVISCGETAGLNPLVASRVTENGYAAQLSVAEWLVCCIMDDDQGSCALSWKNATLDLRGTSLDSLFPAGEYSGDHILFAVTENTLAAGFSFNIGDRISIGPAYCTDGGGGNIWFTGKASCGSAAVISALAVDEHDSYRRVYGVFEHGALNLIYGWDGTGYFGQLAVRKEKFNGAVSMSVPGIYIEYRPADDLLFLASHRESGWFQGEIQNKYSCFVTEVELHRSPGNIFDWGFGVGIELGNNILGEHDPFGIPSFSEEAVTF